MTREPYGGKPPFIKGSDTSEAASKSMEPYAGSIQDRIRMWVHGRGDHGATLYEIETHFDLRHQTTSPRVRELYLKGWFYDSGRRRATDSGRGAIVWICRDEPKPPPNISAKDEARNLRRENAELRAKVRELEAELDRTKALAYPRKAKRTPIRARRGLTLPLPGMEN